MNSEHVKRIDSLKAELLAVKSTNFIDTQGREMVLSYIRDIESREGPPCRISTTVVKQWLNIG